MPGFRLNRRALLRGAGGVAIALPWLEIMTPRAAGAATAAPKRFVGVYTPGGTVLSAWRPSGTASQYTFGPILSPLAPVKDRVLVMDGLDMKCAIGEQNQAGLIGLLTGTPQTPEYDNFAAGPSLDQVLASRLSGGYALPSLELAVRWGTGKSHGLPHPINILSFRDAPGFAPIPPKLDPAAIWQDLFGATAPSPSSRTWDKSILDAVDKRYVKLSQRLGAADRARLEQHLTSLRELEQRVAQGSFECARPALPDTSDYDPAAGLQADDNGSIRDVETDAAIPKVGRLMMDILVMALACEITPVATLMWSDTEAKHTLPWLGLNEHVHFYMNDGGHQPDELTQIFTWYATQHLYLIEQLAQVSVGEHTLLDETVVFFGSHLQHPATHAKTDMPFLLAGGGLPGKWHDAGHRPHNDLLLALCNLLGDGRTTFGDPQFCTGPLGGLT
jgi:hypothetical protein